MPVSEQAVAPSILMHLSIYIYAAYINRYIRNEKNARNPTYIQNQAAEHVKDVDNKSVLFHFPLLTSFGQ